MKGAVLPNESKLFTGRYSQLTIVRLSCDGQTTIGLSNQSVVNRPKIGASKKRYIKQKGDLFNLNYDLNITNNYIV